MEFVFEWGKDIVGKTDNAGYHHFLIFPQCFQKSFCSWLLKLGLALKGQEESLRLYAILLPAQFILLTVQKKDQKGYNHLSIICMYPIIGSFSSFHNVFYLTEDSFNYFQPI